MMKTPIAQGPEPVPSNPPTLLAGSGHPSPGEFVPTDPSMLRQFIQDIDRLRPKKESVLWTLLSRVTSNPRSSIIGAIALAAGGGGELGPMVVDGVREYFANGHQGHDHVSIALAVLFGIDRLLSKD